MSSIVEIVHINTSEELRAEPTLGDPVVDYLAKVDGCLSVRRGFQLEDPTKAYIIITWAARDSNERMRERDDFAAFMTALKSLGTVSLMQFIAFDADTTNAFSASVTEITTITAKEAEGHSLDDVGAVIARIRANEHLAKGGRPPIAWGRDVVDGKPVGVLVIGWDSVEAHLASYTGPPFDATTRDLIAISEPATNHVVLR